MHPFVVTDETKAMVNSNIAHLLNGFLACSEFENVIFCWVLHEQHILRVIQCPGMLWDLYDSFGAPE